MINKTILQLLHIETLFIIGVVGTFIYLSFQRKNPLNEFEKFAREVIKQTRKTNTGEEEKVIGYQPNQPKKKKKYKHEERCREIFQNIYGAKFVSVRPGWLKNPVTGKNLELDGFNASIRTPIGKGLAFEYDGAQHAKYVPRYHPSGAQEFLYQVKKDSWKDLMCKKENIVLVRIPDFVAFEDLERFIKTKLRRMGLLTEKSFYG